jgi:hypothetical protein
MKNQQSDKPFDPKSKTRQCTQIKSSGVRCGCPALRDQYTCYFHTMQIQRRANPRHVHFPILEDRYAIQAAIMEVIYRFSTGQLIANEVEIYIKLLRLAVSNGRNLDFDSEEVRANVSTEPLLTQPVAQPAAPPIRPAAPAVAPPTQPAVAARKPSATTDTFIVNPPITQTQTKKPPASAETMAGLAAEAEALAKRFLRTAG